MKNIIIAFIVIIFSCTKDDTNLMLVPKNDGGITLNIPLSRSLQNPTFSADGQFIIFSTDFETHIANNCNITINGSNPTRFTNFSGYDSTSISPNGKQIIFESISSESDNSNGTKLAFLNL